METFVGYNALVFKRSIIFFSIMLGLGALYAVFIEPTWLEVSRHEITGRIRQELTIAHLTDLHFHNFGTIEKKVLSIVNAESPDIVLVTGDTLDGPQSLASAAQFFQGLKPPLLGIWAVLGNWENWSGNNVRELFLSFGVRLLVNESTNLRKDFVLFGFDDSFSGKPERALASKAERNTSFCVDMIHSPEFVHDIIRRCPLILAGHTHGGQVRLPFVPPFWLPEGSGNYVSGWYDLPDAKLFVSRGIGTSILPVRFFSRPEIAFITVRRQKR